jgi:hypothetical protein
MNTRMQKKTLFCRQIIAKIPGRCQRGTLFYHATTLAPPPKNVEQGFYEYVDCKKGTIFFKLTTWQLLNSLDTVDKLNNSSRLNL